MKKLFQLLVTLLSFSGTAAAQAQNKTITGRVISFEESIGLEAVTVTVKGKNYTTGTHADGTFSITVDAAVKTLVFSLQDYQTTALIISDRQDYEIVLKRNSSIAPESTRDIIFPDPVTGYLVAIGE